MSWKRTVWIGVGVLVGLPALACGGSGLVGLLLDGAVELSVEAELAAPPERIVDVLDDADGLARWWSVAMDSHGMQVVAQPGPTSGVGTRVDFVAGGVAAETWEILHVGPTRVAYDVNPQPAPGPTCGGARRGTSTTRGCA
jgi:hypothetical protein